MTATGLMKRIRLGDEVLTYCGRCKEERSHQVVSFNSTGRVDRVTCQTCHNTHLFREPQTGAKKASVARSPRVGSTGARDERTAIPANARAYSPKEVFAAGEWVSHPKFGSGEVLEVRQGKIDVKFGREMRTLLHAG